MLYHVLDILLIDSQQLGQLFWVGVELITCILVNCQERCVYHEKSHCSQHFRAFFSNFDKCQPEVADEIIFSATVNLVCLDIRVKFGDSRPNYSILCQLHPLYAVNAVFGCILWPTRNS